MTYTMSSYSYITGNTMESDSCCQREKKERTVLLLKVAAYHITPLIVARAGYFLTISLTGMAVLKMSFLRIWYVASIRAFIFPLSWLLTGLQCSFSNSTKCSLWIAAVVPSKDGTTFQKSNLLEFLVFGCSDAVFSMLALD